MKTSPDQQTDAGKTPGQTAFEEFHDSFVYPAGFPKWNEQPEHAQKAWQKSASTVLTKHMPLVTQHDLLQMHPFSMWTNHDLVYNIAANITDKLRLRSCLVPEAAAVEWDEWHVPAFGEKLDENCERKCERGKVMIRRKKQAESPTQDERAGEQVEALSPTLSPALAFSPSPWWAKHPWNRDDGADCVRCGTSMKLNEGADWDEDQPEFNVCNSCAQELLGEIWARFKAPHQPPQVAGDGATEVFAHVVRVANEALAKDCAELQQKNQGLEQDANALREQLNTANQLYQIAVNEREELREQVEGLKKDQSLLNEYRNAAKMLYESVKEYDMYGSGQYEGCIREMHRTISDFKFQLTTAQKERESAQDALSACAHNLTLADAEIARLKEECAVRKAWMLKVAETVFQQESPTTIEPVLNEIRTLHKKAETTLRTTPAKGLTTQQVDTFFNEAFDGRHSGDERRKRFAELVNEWLSTQPVSPWISIAESGGPKDQTQWVFVRGGDYHPSASRFDMRSDSRTHYMVIPDLPLPVVVEDDGFEKWWNAQSKTGKHKEESRIAWNAALSTKTGGAA